MMVSFCITPSKITRKGACPSGMLPVKDKKRRVSVCVDRFEYSFRTSNLKKRRPVSNVNYFECRRYCKKQNKRLLTHNEWLAACEGTKPQYCNRHQPHPIIQKLKSRKAWYFRGMNCKDPKNTWRSCMQDPSLNYQKRSLARNGDYSKCVSKHGVYNMVGNLGEWVHDYRKKNGIFFGRFNGGLYPQMKSSCNYTTIAHKLDYKDYSIGCRCAKSLKSKFK